MTNILKLCEHESVEWIVRKIPKFTKLSILKKLNTTVTSIDVNLDVFVLGTNHGTLFILCRKSDLMETFIIKKNKTICHLKLIRTVDLSIAIGFEDGSIYILNIPFNKQLNYSQMVQFVVPTEHRAAISSMAWSKNSEKLYSGDANGLICCTEIDHLSKTVTAYEVCKTQSGVYQLAYDHRSLIISTDTESFMWDFNVNKRIQIGTQSRNECGKFGISFVNKLCKNKEMEIIVTRPDCKIWISDSTGTIKRSIVLKSNLIFAPEKSFGLLPCFTSQSKSELIDDIKLRKTKFHLGLSIPITADEVLFWSEDAIVIVNIKTGHIISSSCNLGKIQTVSICVLDKLLKTNSNLSSESSPQEENYATLYEIWILRQSLNENDSKLVRLSFIPLITSKLLIDPFYFISQSRIANNSENIPIYLQIPEQTKPDEGEPNPDSIIIDKVNEITIDETSDTNHNPSYIKDGVSESNSSSSSQFENWLYKIKVKKPTIDVVEALNDMRSNVLEITKEVMKQGHAMFENNDEEGLEQALELTEEGLKMNFEKTELSLDDASMENDNRLNITVKDSHINNITTPIVRREKIKIHLINLDEDVEEINTSEIFKKPESLPEPNKEIEQSENHPSLISTSYDSEFNTGDSYENSDSFFIESIAESGSPLVVDNYLTLTAEISEEKSPDLHFNEEKLFNTNEESKESECNPMDFESDEISNSDYLHVLNSETQLGTSSSMSIQSIDLGESPKSIIIDDQLYTNEILHNKSTDDDKISESIVLNISIEDKPGFQISQTIVNGNNLELPSFINLDEQIDEQVQLPEIDDDKSPGNDKEEICLTNALLLKCNKWISHRGPTLSSSAKLSSMIVNKRMVWLSDTKGYLHVGFRRDDSDSYSDSISSGLSANDKMLWLLDTELRVDRILSSPSGFILWRDKAGEISVYVGVTKIWSPKVIKEKVLLKAHWEVTMRDIKDFDIDDDMAVIVTKTGQLKVMNGISSRKPYTRSSTANIMGHVTLATIFNGIIWCVTEVGLNNSNILSQYIFACVAKDENDEFNICYWRTVPLARDLVKSEEKEFGCMGGSELIRSIQLGVQNLAWILTLDNMCFFSQNICRDNPSGDGVWYQITLQFLSTSPSYSEDNLSNLHNRVEKMLGYPEVDTRYKRNSSQFVHLSVFLSGKCAPKKSKGNGLLWITSTERNSPCILFESNRNIIGHNWVDCFEARDRSANRIMGLPAITSWTCVEASFKNTLWLLHKSEELFCYLNESKMRSVVIPTSFGRPIKISAYNYTVAVLTSQSKLIVRSGIMENNPFGSDWKEIKGGRSKKDTIRNISCSDNEIWIFCEHHDYFIKDINSHLSDSSKKFSWDLVNFKISDSKSKRLSNIQSSKFGDKNRTWGISDPDGYVYMAVWELCIKNFTWTYIPGPRAKSIHVSSENLWMVEQFTGNIFIRCGLNWQDQPAGDYWIHVPLITGPVIDLAVTAANHVVVIDSGERLLLHRWAIIEGNEESDLDLQTSTSTKIDDQDWELLN